MFKKFLYCSAILSITSLGSINNIYASTLQELFKNSNNKVVFENGVISCNDKTLDEDDYIHENNTTFIDINTLPIYIDTNTLSIQSNNGGGGSIHKYISKYRRLQ